MTPTQPEQAEAANGPYRAVDSRRRLNGWTVTGPTDCPAVRYGAGEARGIAANLNAAYAAGQARERARAGAEREAVMELVEAAKAHLRPPFENCDRLRAALRRVEALPPSTAAGEE